jgi:hypothetical protein
MRAMGFRGGGTIKKFLHAIGWGGSNAAAWRGGAV